MNNSNIQYIAFMVFAVFISSASQIVLKKSANKTYKNIFYEYFNAPVIISYTVFLSTSLFTVYALKYVPLSIVPIIESTGYIFIAILGKVFLKEDLNKKKIIGILIIAGIISLFLSKKEKMTNVVLIIVTVFCIVATLLNVTGLPSNFVVEKVIGFSVLLVTIVGNYLRFYKKDYSAVPKVVVAISTIIAFVLMIL